MADERDILCMFLDTKREPANRSRSVISQQCDYRLCGQVWSVHVIDGCLSVAVLV